VCEEGQFASDWQQPALNFSGAKIQGSVLLSRGLKADGGVALRDATIGKDLVCEEGQFASDWQQPALNFSGAKIQGSVLLSYGLKAYGG
jgi:hypothetical protein